MPGLKFSKPSHHGQNRLAFAGSTLAHNTQRLPSVQGKADAVDGIHNAIWRVELHAQFFNFYQRHDELPFLGVQCIAQTIADEVEAVQRDGQQRSGKQQNLRRLFHYFGSVLNENAPTGHRFLNA